MISWWTHCRTSGVRSVTIVHDFPKNAVDIVVNSGISGLVCLSSVGRAARVRGDPKALRTEQGSELTSQALGQWAYANDVTLKLIEPGKPTQNAYIELFNGKFRVECLNEHGSTTLAHARAITAAWRQNYNEEWPRSALNYLSPGKISGPLWLFLYDLLAKVD
ncbi:MULTISPECIES: integrase core domain-containing protein [Mycetohabitans]|uniref:Putative transposase n=1 Tax=Mycetohabitans endofungorum TaxID=417203 RepID=A0A2P5KAP5_9BURK|nr:putative transposase [Mycetohabitans endofungorum]